MKISIVTISFNQAKYLEDAINSVLDQEYNDLEYIVIDPGSTDGSREILEKYRSKISKIILEPDGGPADGLNRGFSIANGEVFGFLNSDDIYLPNTIKEVARFFSKNTDIDVVSAHCYIIDENGRTMRRAYSDRYSLEKYAYGVCAQVQPSTFFRSTAFNRVKGFNSTNKITWDGEFFVDIGIAGGKFKTINKIWSGYRVYEGTITSSIELNEKRKYEAKRNFKKIKRRDEMQFDILLRIGWRLYKHISNPKALLERLLYGPIQPRKN